YHRVRTGWQRTLHGVHGLRWQETSYSLSMPPQIIPVLVSANGEWEAVKAILQPSSLQLSLAGEFFEILIENQPCLFFHSGWGKIATAASTQFVIDHYHPELVINIGTSGGFTGSSEI